MELLIVAAVAALGLGYYVKTKGAAAATPASQAAASVTAVRNAAVQGGFPTTTTTPQGAPLPPPPAAVASVPAAAPPVTILANASMRVNTPTTFTAIATPGQTPAQVQATFATMNGGRPLAWVRPPVADPGSVLLTFPNGQIIRVERWRFTATIPFVAGMNASAIYELAGDAFGSHGLLIESKTP